MAVSHVELYEALKGPVGEKAARMIAEIVPVAADVARKQDVEGAESRLRLELSELRGEMREGFSSIRTEMAADRAQMHVLNSRTIRWLLAFSIPMWAGTWGTMIAVLLRST